MTSDVRPLHRPDQQRDGPDPEAKRDSRRSDPPEVAVRRDEEQRRGHDLGVRRELEIPDELGDVLGLLFLSEKIGHQAEDREQTGQVKGVDRCREVGAQQVSGVLAQ